MFRDICCQIRPWDMYIVPKADFGLLILYLSFDISETFQISLNEQRHSKTYMNNVTTGPVSDMYIPYKGYENYLHFFTSTCNKLVKVLYK